MILTLDFVAKRYGMLPSQLLREGTSLDIIIADAAQGYQNQQAAQAQNPSSTANHGLTEEQMLAMVAATRNS
jgi:hypothetical protein